MMFIRVVARLRLSGAGVKRRRSRLSLLSCSTEALKTLRSRSDLSTEGASGEARLINGC